MTKLTETECSTVSDRDTELYLKPLIICGKNEDL